MEEKTQARILNAEDRSQEKIKDTCTEFSVISMTKAHRCVLKLYH